MGFCDARCFTERVRSFPTQRPTGHQKPDTVHQQGRWSSPNPASVRRARPVGSGGARFAHLATAHSALRCRRRITKGERVSRNSPISDMVIPSRLSATLDVLPAPRLSGWRRIGRRFTLCSIYADLTATSTGISTSRSLLKNGTRTTARSPSGVMLITLAFTPSKPIASTSTVSPTLYS